VVGNDVIVAHVANQVNALPTDFIDIEENIPSRVVVLGKDGIKSIAFPNRLNQDGAFRWTFNGRDDCISRKRLSEYAKA